MIHRALLAAAISVGALTACAPGMSSGGNQAPRSAAGERAQPDPAEAEALVRAEEVDAAVVPDPSNESPVGLRVVGLSDAPDEVVAGLSVAAQGRS